MKAARTKLRMTAGPASSMAAAVPRRSPVPMEPPTATIVICPAVSWWRRPDSANSEGVGIRGLVLVYQNARGYVDGIDAGVVDSEPRLAPTERARPFGFAQGRLWGTV